MNYRTKLNEAFGDKEPVEIEWVKKPTDLIFTIRDEYFISTFDESVFEVLRDYRGSVDEWLYYELMQVIKTLPFIYVVDSINGESVEPHYIKRQMLQNDPETGLEMDDEWGDDKEKFSMMSYIIEYWQKHRETRIFHIRGHVEDLGS